MRRLSRPLVLVGLALLAGAGLVFATERVKHQLESTLEGLFHVPIRIQRIGFLPGRVTLHQLRLQLPGGPVAPSAPLTVERLQLEGSVWELLWRGVGSFPSTGAVRSIVVKELTLSVAGIPLRAEGQLNLRPEDGGLPQAAGWLKVQHPLLHGEVEVVGPIGRPVLMGWLETSRFGRRHFLAQLALHRQACELVQLRMMGDWSANGRIAWLRPADGSGSARWRGEFRLFGPGVRLQAEVVPQEGRWVQAAVWVYREGLAPLPVTLRWAVRRPAVLVQAQLFQEQALLEGELGLEPPYHLAAVLRLSGLELQSVAEWFSQRLGGARIAGRVSGQVELSGTSHEILSRGELFGEEGRFNQQAIRGMKLRFHGKGPILWIESSHLVRAEGTLGMEGSVDLRRLGRPDFFQGVRLKSTGRNAVSWAGWQVGPLPGWRGDAPGVQMRRSASSASEGGEGAVGVNIQVNQDEEFVGIERRGKF